jgi:hypothetical protein
LSGSPLKKAPLCQLANTWGEWMFLTNITEFRVNTEPQEMLIPSSVRRLSEGSFDAECGKCLRRSLPVDAVGPEHAWSELRKDGWTSYTSPVGRTGGISCLSCLSASARSAPGRP